MSLTVVESFPEEDLNEGGENNPGFFRAWLGMQLEDGRYCILRKLGWGLFSTVWLVRDFELDRYVALKIMTRKATSRIESGESDEVAMLEKVISADATHKGRRHLLERYETFSIIGPSGSHQRIVTEVLGPSIVDLRRQFKSRLPIDLVKTYIRQVLFGLDYLHTACGIIHTDLKFDNLLLRLSDIASIIPREIVAHPAMAYLGSEYQKPFPYVVKSQPIGLSLKSYNHLQVEVAIADLGHAHWVDRHSGDSIQPLGLRAPEVILGHPWNQAVDIWSIGCLTLEILSAPLFEMDIFAKDQALDEDHLTQMTEALEEQFPEDMLSKSRNRNRFFKQDGTFIHSADAREPN